MEPEGIQLEHLLRAIVHEVLVVVVEAGVVSFFNYGEGDEGPLLQLVLPTQKPGQNGVLHCSFFVISTWNIQSLDTKLLMIYYVINIKFTTQIQYKCKVLLSS